MHSHGISTMAQTSGSGRAGRCRHRPRELRVVAWQAPSIVGISRVWRGTECAKFRQSRGLGRCGGGWIQRRVSRSVRWRPRHRGGHMVGTSRRARVIRPWYMLVFALVGVVVVVVSSAIAYDGTASAPERFVFEAINGLPDFLRAPMWVFQLAGLIGLPLVVALVALVLRKFRLVLALLLLVPIKIYIEQPLIKSVVDRQRPGRTQDDPILRDVPA